MEINKLNYISTNKTSQVNKSIALSRVNSGASFEAVLNEQLNKNSEVQFSKHAKERLEQRGIAMTGTLMDSLNVAVAKAKSKGAKDVVIIGENQAFIVNVPNNVVVTTMQGREMKDNIFTNIDSAIIL